MILTPSRFGKSNGALNFKSRQAIATDDLRRIAPSVFAEQAHDSRSDRYTYIPTENLLARLAEQGFRPYAVMQGGSRDEAKRGFTKHLLRFRHDSMTLVKGELHNEIVMLNSHDGTSSYQLSAGVYRCACENGLVVSQSLISEVRVPHKGDVIQNVIDGCCDLLESLPEVNDSVAQMSSLMLTEGEQRAFANAASVARYGEDPAPFDAEKLNLARRREDVGSDLWKTLNRTQESLIRGGVSYVQRNEKGQRSRRRTREINGIDQNTNINRALWTLAEEMRKIKASA